MEKINNTDISVEQSLKEDQQGDYSKALCDFF